jgi:hypothetical protein
VRLVEREPSDDGVPVVMAEPVEGTLLGEVMRRARVLDVAAALRLALELGEILESLHEVGLVHGGVSADTVLVVGGGHDERVRLLPPPVAARPDRPDTREAERADLLAFGSLLYDLLAGDASSRADRSVPIGKRRRGLAPPLERLVMETLGADRARLDMSEVVNRLWIERERLRGRHPRRDPALSTGELRRLVAVAAVATCVTLSWLNTTPAPGPVAPTPPSIASADMPSPRLAGPPALPPGAPDREPPHRPVLAGTVAVPPRLPAASPARPPAPGPATPGPAARKVLERITIEPPPPPPVPPEPSPAAVTRVPATETVVTLAPPSPVPVAPAPTASQRAVELAEPPPAMPAPPAVPEAEPPKRGAPDVLPEVAAAPTPAQTPADAPPAVRVMLVRGAPGPGFEAGPSALSTGHGARGAAGVIQGRLGPVVKRGEPRSLSSLASAAAFPAEPGDLRPDR